MSQDETVVAEMACQELVEVITDYLEGTLGAEDVRRLEAHIAQCDPCTTYIEQMRQSMRAVGRLSSSDLDPSTRSRLVEAFRSWRGTAAD
jgi:anti-sigma factor RsiW